jgi:DNA-binding NarL/FixJ family response regulator
MSRVRVVLVEDNEVFREALELMLGMREELEIVAAAADGTAGIDAVLEHLPDVVVVDYRLPGIDGAEVTRELLAKLPHLGVVALTAHADESECAELLEAGASACLRKDQELDELVAAIEQAAGARA